MEKMKLLVTTTEMKFIDVASKHKTRKDAQKAALARYKSDDSDDCEIIEAVVNSCLALSISVEPNKLEYAFNPNGWPAMESSLNRCKERCENCKAVYTDCSLW